MVAKLQHMTHDTFDECLLTCQALESLIKQGKIRAVPTPNAGGLWDIGYVVADKYDAAMADRRGRIILAGPKEIARL